MLAAVACGFVTYTSLFLESLLVTNTPHGIILHMHGMIPCGVIATRRHYRKRHMWVTKPQTTAAKRQAQRMQTTPNLFVLPQLHVQLRTHTLNLPASPVHVPCLFLQRVYTAFCVSNMHPKYPYILCLETV